MEIFLTYSLKVMAVQLLFLLLYEGLLKNERFFKGNRYFLLGSLLASLLLPCFPLTVNVGETLAAVRLEELIINGLPAETNADTGIHSSKINWYSAIYIFGAVGFGLLFTIKIIRLGRLLHRSQRQVWNGTRIFLIKDLPQAFTFFNRICVGALREYAPCVIEHEKVHQRQWHSLDLLFLELMKIVFWFNPLLYRYHKRLVEVHEFEADQAAYPKFRKLYYQSLLTEVLGADYAVLTNHWYRPKLIKRRLFMLQKKEKTVAGMLKYSMVIPVLAVSVVMLSAGNIPSQVALDFQELTGLTETARMGDTITYDFAKVDVYPRAKECENVSEKGAEQCTMNFLNAHVAKTFAYPAEAQEKGIQGRLYVDFTIDTQGKVTNVKARGSEKILQDEAERIVRLLPDFVPGKVNGKNVNVNFTYPITFKLMK